MSGPGYFVYHQNNSGGSFDGPAVRVIVEADTLKEASARIEPHVTLCGDSGLYADYDNCGCCPCCGHRWEEPWGEQPVSGPDARGILPDGLTWLGGVSVALIPRDGPMIVGDTEERRAEIEGVLS